ncbi:MAG TPA: hypothetical protein VJW51_00495 [Candidatus Acidoferrales bacterium]|nr:hypothetical protein [Candidatus Acidoferrales bacterium]
MALYTAPDQVMPVASCLAALIGIVLIFWNKLAGFFLGILGRSARGPRDPGASTAAGISPARDPQFKK